MCDFLHTWGDDEEERVGLLTSKPDTAVRLRCVSSSTLVTIFLYIFCALIFVSSIHVESTRKGGSCVFYCKWDFYQFGSAKSLPFVIHLVAKQILQHTDTFLSAYCQHRNITELIRTMFSKLSKSSSLDKRGSKSHPPASLLKGVHSV